MIALYFSLLCYQELKMLQPQFNLTRDISSNLKSMLLVLKEVSAALLC